MTALHRIRLTHAQARVGRAREPRRRVPAIVRLRARVGPALVVAFEDDSETHLRLVFEAAAWPWAAAPGSIMATAQGQLSDTLYSKKQILEVMPNGQGSHVPAVYASGGTIYALCFSEDSNPGLPTVVEISCGTQRRKQVTQFQELQRRRGTVPLFVCLKTARGRLELLPGGSGSKGFRFAGMRSVVSVETHSTPKMVGGEARQATVTLSAPTAGETCPLQVAGSPRAIQVAGAPAPAPVPPRRPAAPPATPVARRGAAERRPRVLTAHHWTLRGWCASHEGFERKNPM